jgi:hypothetical protein
LIKTRRNNSIGRGILIGAATGFVVVGLFKVRIPIDGIMNKFNRNRNKLNKFAFKKK